MSLEDQFNSAVALIKSLPAQDNENLLKMYSLFKQATIGDASGKKPGMLDFVAKAKFEAWETLKGVSQEEAKKRYIALVNELAQ